MPSGMENNFLERTANESLSEKERTTWVAVKRKGVLPKISSYSEYTAAIAEGMSEASKALVRIGYNGIPTAKLAQLTHHRIFSEVTPWAGQFSKLTLNSGGFIRRAVKPRPSGRGYKALGRSSGQPPSFRGALLLDILPNNLNGRSPARGRKVAPAPQDVVPIPRADFRVLLAEHSA